MQADGVRRTAAGDEQPALDLRRREPAAELQHERVDAVVGDEQVRAEPDRRHREPTLGRPREHMLELGRGLRSGKRARGPAGAERRVARERDALIDLHASASSSTATARSTSPAPTVSTVSPARAWAASKRAPASTSDAKPIVIPGRRSESASTISLPPTPATGSSRAG